MIEILRVIVMACSVTSMGVGGEYKTAETLDKASKVVMKNALDLQRGCHRQLLACMKKSKIRSSEATLQECLSH